MGLSELPGLPITLWRDQFSPSWAANMGYFAVVTRACSADFFFSSLFIIIFFCVSMTREGQAEELCSPPHPPTPGVLRSLQSGDPFVFLPPDGHGTRFLASLENKQQNSGFPPPRPKVRIWIGPASLFKNLPVLEVAPFTIPLNLAYHPLRLPSLSWTCFRRWRSLLFG